MYQTAVQQQDTLRPLRNFVSLLSGATSDQTYPELDGWAINPSGQFVTQNQWGGVSLEGQPVNLSVSASAQGVSMSSPVVWIGLAALAYFMLK